MHKHLLAAVLSLAVAMTGASALEAHAKTTFVTIGTGGITGVYYPTGGAIAKIVNAKKDKYDIRATVESTGASVFNINAIMAGDLEFGIAQADRQYQAYNGLSEWEGKPQKDLRAVFALAPEAVTFVAAEDSGIKSLKDAKGKVVNIGNPGSGNRQNAMTFSKPPASISKKTSRPKASRPPTRPACCRTAVSTASSTPWAIPTGISRKPPPGSARPASCLSPTLSRWSKSSPTIP